MRNAEFSEMSYLTRSPISLDALLAEVSSSACGGTCLFLGTVRDGPDEQGVTAIEYSAYEEMVEVEFGRLLADAGARWPEARIAVRHRLGTIPVGEASIAIAAAAPHRAQAFEACRYVIEEVKRRVPVWKKELRVDGTEVWVDPHGRPTSSPPVPLSASQRGGTHD
jgi:molybdopterin synthase catalytic subunit